MEERPPEPQRAVSRGKIVLYFPMQADPAKGLVSGRDLLPLSVLTIAGLPDREGYEVVIIDGNLYSEAEAQARVIAACEGALAFRLARSASRLAGPTGPDLTL